ncbi:FHA domain-containing protein DDL-like [Rosa sericea]
MGRNLKNHSESPVHDHGSPPRRSPSRKSQSRTERSPKRHRKSQRGSSPVREKHSSRPKSPKHARSPTPPPRFPSPRTKRLRRAQAGRVPEREHERNNGRGIGRDLQEGGPEREVGSDRNEKLSGRDHTDGKSSRSRHVTSPSDRHRRSRHRSPSPQHPDETKYGDKVIEGHERNHHRGSDRSMQREKGSDRENDTEGMERGTEKDSSGHRSSSSRHGESTSPLNGHQKKKHKTHSPRQAADTRAHYEVPESREAEHGIDENDSVAMMRAAEEALEAQKRQKPSFELSGKLAAETNRFRGITLLYTEPAEGRPPRVKWRLYVFKGGEAFNEPIKIHRQSCYLFGRERRVADIPTDHPSCSKQHAVLQFRQVEKEQPDGTLSKEVKPYVMDLGSTNKTFVNETAIEPQRYYELMEKDTIKFGNSSREYVLLHENSMD